MTDLELLDEVLAQDIDDEARVAFQDWRDKLGDGRWTGKLTAKQRGWLEGVAERAGIGVAEETQNLVSSGKVKVTEQERASLAAFLKVLPKTRLPPHRRCLATTGCQKHRGHLGDCGDP